MSKNYQSSSDDDFNIYELNRLLDITKSQVFMNRQAAFFGPLMSFLFFVWTEDVPTAATDGRMFYWNPRWFLKLDPEVRKTILMHELWHNARLHMVRAGTRIFKIWNYACDIRINNDLENQGYSFAGTRPWLDHSFDASGTPAAEEDIYDQLMAMSQAKIDALLETLGDSWSGEPPEDEDEDSVGDMIGGGRATKEDMADQVAQVVAAKHQAELSGHAGDVPGSTQKILKQFLTPVVAWEAQFQRFFTDLLEEDYTWARPNRRMLDIIYLPSREEDDGRLDHLIYYLDVSGSVTDGQVIRFNSEVKYIWDVLKPKKLTLVQFDTIIQDVKEFNEGDDFEELVVIGRGGTCLVCVREHMIEHKPTAAIIFTDLGCAPMEPLPDGQDVPTIWVAIQNTMTPIPFGVRINIR